MSITPLVLASFSAVITQGGVEVSASATIDQLRGDVVAGVASFGSANTFGGSSIYDNVTSAARWTGVRIVFDGADLPPGAFHGTVQIDETMGQPRTARLSVVGHLWGIPTQDYPALGPFASSRSWGNKPVAIYLSFGASPRTMVEQKVFQGVTLQKSSRGDTAVLGEISCVDDSLKSANTPLCYSLNPFGGKTRDQIVRELAVLAGFTEDQVIVPAGAVVTKPILLTNASLMPLLAEFVSPENWVPSVDVDGNLLVSRVELKAEPDWVIDARLGDYDLDQIEEQPPGLASRRYYASGAAPVGGSAPETTPEANDVVGLYNPLCIKVRPSGASYLQVDGSYRTLSTAEEMVIGRTETETIVVAGRVHRRVIKTFGMSNPLKADPNFDTSPPGTDYDGAYSDGTYHVFDAESLREIRRETTTSSYNSFGAVTGRFLEVQEWHAPKAAGTWPDRLGTPVSVPSALRWVFSDQTTRVYPAEHFHTTKTIDRRYIFVGDGALNAVKEWITDWNSPQGRCDVLSGGVVVQQYDYKYADGDWRSGIQENFRTSKYTEDSYYAPSGVMSDIRQIVHEYVNPQAAVPADPLSSPPYLFADGAWRTRAAYIYNDFRPRITTTSFRESGVGSYEIITTTADPLTGTSASAVQVISGNIPGVPTAGSLMTGLVLRPIFGTLIDPVLDEFADSKKALALPWAETTDEISRVTLRQMQRDSAIVRQLTMAANPLIAPMQTIRIIDPKRSIDALHLATGRTINYNTETGDCSMSLTSEFWVR